MWPQHAKRRRVIADRYANSNVMRSDSMSGIQQRAARFVARCEASIGQSLDIFVRPLHQFDPSPANGRLIRVPQMCTPLGTTALNGRGPNS